MSAVTNSVSVSYDIEKYFSNERIQINHLKILTLLSNFIDIGAVEKFLIKIQKYY